MNFIGKKLYTHLSLGDDTRYYNKAITSSEAFEVSSYAELVRLVAKITFNNPEINIYYRGQKKDHYGSDNRSEILPSLYRGSFKSLNKTKLEIATSELIKKFEDNKIDGYKKIKKFPIVAWSILQHYEVCDTPLLDVTDSLLVACSFALSGESDGYLYLLGLPHANGSVTYSTEHELFNIKLNSICPPEALRPYYQNGYLIGCFPEFPITKSKLGHNFGNRLVAKFKLNYSGFWNEHFHPIPNDALFPNEDDSRIQQITSEIKKDLLIMVVTKIISEKKRKDLLKKLYGENLNSEVLNLILNGWDKDEIIQHLGHRGFDKNDIDSEYDSIKEVL